MSLAVEVGLLAYLNANDADGASWLRESLGKVNAVLAENNLPAHTEPETLTSLQNRASLRSYPYSFLHYLRRFAAHARKRPTWQPKPFAESENPAKDPIVAHETDMLSSHLLCHSDCEGFYVPIDFAEPLFAEKGQLPGGMLGSSQGLMRELVSVAPFLDIKLSNGQLPDVEADRINGIVKADGPFWIEMGVWICLFEAARLSIKHRSAICFC